MVEFLNSFFATNQFIPHGHCYLWQPRLVWLHILSDTLIASAYYSIPLMLVFFVRKRRDLPFNWIFLMFGAFIVACGTNHLMEIWTLWHPTYWLSGSLKAITAFFSVCTAMELVSLIPQALALPNPAQLEVTNVALQKEIAERKQAELALERLQQHTELILDCAGEGIYGLDAQGNTTFVNPAAARMINWNNAELIGKPMHTIVHHSKPDGTPYPENECPIYAAFKDGFVHHLENEVFWRKDGTSFPVEYVSTPIQEQGKLVGAVVIFRDITERKQTEVALQQLNANLERQVQERTAQLQQALDFEALLKRITDKVRDSLDESQILQTAVQELALVPGVSCCNTALYNLEEGTSTICYEYATANPKAQARVAQIANFPEVYQQLLQGQYLQFCSLVPNPIRGRVAMLACPILDDQGVLGDLWLINQHDNAFDELEIRLVQQVANQCAIALRQARLYQAATAQVKELEKLNQLKDDFLSTVSHELRTPVSNMKMSIHMLRTVTTADRRERYLEILQKECAREIQLIDTLLDLQRLEAASYTTTNEAIILPDWLPTVIEPFHSRLQSRQQNLRVELPSFLPPIISDRASLERILAELLNNACKYTPTDGEIIFSVECKTLTAQKKDPDFSPQNQLNGMAVSLGLNANNQEEFPVCTLHFVPRTFTIFTISNQAEIPAIELPYIFDKFYRVPNADPWKQGGTGLGLALVRKLVQQLEGTIQVKSSRGWTTFTIQLPNQPSEVENRA